MCTVFIWTKECIWNTKKSMQLQKNTLKPNELTSVKIPLEKNAETWLDTDSRFFLNHPQ